MAKKFNFKGVTKSLPANSAELGAAIAGMVLSRKFIDLSKVIKNPDSPVLKYQGAVKAILGLVGMGALKPGWQKAAALGVGLEGGFTLLRQMTAKKKDDGTLDYQIDTIGETDDLTDSSAVAGDDDGDQGIESEVSGMGEDDDIDPIDDDDF